MQKLCLVMVELFHFSSYSKCVIKWVHLGPNQMGLWTTAAKRIETYGEALFICWICESTDVAKVNQARNGLRWRCGLWKPDKWELRPNSRGNPCMECIQTISLSTKVKGILRILRAQQIQKWVCLHLSSVHFFPFFLFWHFQHFSCQRQFGIAFTFKWVFTKAISE